MKEGFDPEEEEQEAQRLEKERMDLIQYNHDLEWLLNTSQGIRFIQKLIVDSGTFTYTFFGNSKDAFVAGKRAWGLDLWNKIYAELPEKAVRILRVEKPKEKPKDPEAE